MLRTFADISGLNIVIDQSVQGAVDVSLNEVPWDQALDIILRDHKLGIRSTARSCGSRRSPCWPTRKHSAASWPKSGRSPATSKC